MTHHTALFTNGAEGARGRADRPGTCEGREGAACGGGKAVEIGTGERPVGSK